MAPATLTINSRNYGAWSLRGWLLCRMAGLDFIEEVVPAGDPAARAHCRSVRGVHGGFVNLRSALPMNMTALHPGFPVFSGAQADIARVVAAIWRDCLGASRGPFLFGARPTVADAMFAPICRGSPRTTSTSTPRAGPTGTRCWRCPTSSSGRRWPRRSRRTWWSSRRSSRCWPR